MLSRCVLASLATTSAPSTAPALSVLADRLLSSWSAQSSASCTAAQPPSPWGPGHRVLRPPAPHRRHSTAYASAAPAGSSAPSLAAAAPQGPGSAAAEGAELIVDASAFKRLEQLSSQQGNAPVHLRVEVEGGGCSGFQYKFSLVDTTNVEDRVYGTGKCKVVCDAVSLDFLKGAKVEFEDSLMRQAFVVNSNPNADKSGSCGCGSSFSVKF